MVSAGTTQSRESSMRDYRRKGFTLFMLKAVISGRGDEVLDLAKTNLWP